MEEWLPLGTVSGKQDQQSRREILYCMEPLRVVIIHVITDSNSSSSSGNNSIPRNCY